MTAPKAENRLTEWLLRGFALAAYGSTVHNLALAWNADRSRATLLLLLATEGFTLLLVLFARSASQRDTRWSTLLLNVYAGLWYALVDPNATHRLVPEFAGATLQIAGALWQFAAKCSLGRSFGVLPAVRGIVVKGPYRVIRHPIYLGYLVGHLAFLLVNFSWRNLAVLGALYIVQWRRMEREEAILSTHSTEYRCYQHQVRWRIIPGLY